MIKVNEAGWDRALRVLIGGGLIYFGWAGALGWVGVLLLVVGLVLVLTGLIGYCPLYSLLGIRTRDSSPPDAKYT